MRAEFARAIVDLHHGHDRLVFLTGDLGFMALENVREVFGERFVNAGVAEQNMICVAAGLAREGFFPWVYDIAPFAVLRPYEQIRNDICLHNLPVKIVGNGGGYGYGIMGATHHTLEDVGAMRMLPNMKVYVPFLTLDLPVVVRAMAADPSPNYLRLNTAPRLDFSLPPFGQWRRIAAGTRGVIIGTGPVLGNIFLPPHKPLIDDVEVWHLGILPVRELPDELLQSIQKSRRVLVIEEHYSQCGIHEALARLLLDHIAFPLRFRNLSASGYPSGRYGSQQWHQAESGLAGDTLTSTLKQMFHE